MIQILLEELLQDSCQCWDALKGQSCSEEDSVISKMLAVFAQLLRAPLLSCERLDEVLKTLGRLQKQFTFVLGDRKKLQSFFRGRLTALGLQLNRLVRSTKLLEELCKLPDTDVDEVSNRLLARQVIRRMKNKQMASLIRLYVEDRRRMLI